MSSLKRLMTISVIMTVLGIFAITSMPVWAVPPDCTKTQNGGDERDPLKRCEEKLNDAQGGVLGKLRLLVGEMNKTEGVNLSAMAFTNPRTGEASDLDEHIAKMNRQHGRASDAISESINDDFEEIVVNGGKQKGQKCSWQEDPAVAKNPDDFLPAGYTLIQGSNLGNGNCDNFKAFNAVDKKVTVRERTQPGVCMQVCEDKDVPGLANTKKKDKIRGRYTERRSEGIDSTIRSEDALDAALVELTKSNALVRTYGAATAFAITYPECAADVDAPAAVAFGAKLVLVPTVVALKITTRVVSGLAESGKVFCQQDVAGFNASSACIPAIVAKELAEGSVDVVEFMIDAIDLTVDGFNLFNSDTTLGCVSAIRTRQEEMFSVISGIDGKVNDLKTQVGEMSAGLTEMIEQNRELIVENQEYIRNTREIVLTPHGQRAKLDLYEPDN